MKVDASKRTAASATARGRGTYASQACNVCRAKKTKCDGVKPVCEPCSSSGRHEECSWGRESVRKPRTEAHFEAMRKRADALREYANLLESMLEKCRREHGGVSDEGQSYLQFRPHDADGMILADEFDPTADGEITGDADTGGVITQELCVPTQSLKLDDGSLFLHGNTAIYRFAPNQPIPCPTIIEDTDQYTLLVDGADESRYDPNFDWSRYLPSMVPLDRREHDRLLDLLFKFFTSWCLRIVPGLFLRDMWRVLSVPRSQTPPKTPHYSPMLHNALIAIATAFSDDPRIRDFKSRQYFATAAKSYIEAECQKPNISVVHALSFLGSYHSAQGDQTLGYMYFGMSARISQALGLSIDCSAWVHSGLISDHDRRDRNWAHWTTFTQDVCWSLYVGRDYCVPAPSAANGIPIPFVDADFDQQPWYYPPANIPPQPNYLSTTFAASCELLAIARQIMDVVNGLNNTNARHEVNDELITNIDLQLNTWKGSLSPDVDITIKSRPTATPHRLMMHLSYWWLFILLHRPFYHRKQRSVHVSDREIDHVKLCKRGAENMMELLDTWRTLYGLRYGPITLVQTVFSAGTVFLLIAVQAMSGLRVAQGSLKHSLSQANLCIQHLLEIGRSWHCATSIAEILRNLLQEQLKPLLERRSVEQAQVIIQATQPSFEATTLVSPTRQRSSSQRSPSQRSSSQSQRSSSQSQRSSSQSQRSSSQQSSGQRRQRSTTRSGDPSPISTAQHTPATSPQIVQRSPSSNHAWAYQSAPTTHHTATYYQQPSEQLMRTSHSASSSSSFEPPPGMESYLAMLGGQMLPDTPFMPPFSAMETNPSNGHLQQQHGSAYYGSGQGPVPESEFAVLEQFWNQHFR